jgi:hypothetical protein
VSHCFLVYLPKVLLASLFIFLDMGLPSGGGIFRLTCCCCILTKVSKNRVCITNNYSKDGGFLVLLLLWSLVLQIPSFAVGRVGVDQIEKEKLGEVKE